ncbi:MAG: ATP-grasp domain-containing protein [Clostridia bacterium]|nr:ATP-grasp domain-containing protein [Clostridia bacterium]
MKILLTSIGRRVELVQAFRSSANNLNIPLQIHGSDITDTAPALLFCDKIYQSKRIKDQEYIPDLLNYCEKNSIDLLIPTIDTDLLLLSQNKDKFLKIGTKVLISDEEKIKICRDKRLTAGFFKKAGLLSPEPIDDYKKYNEGFPAFIKPKDGSSSIMAYKVENQEELEVYASQIPDYIVQPFIDGEEYTVDIFCDFSGNPIYITPRMRLAVRAGEVLKTKIVRDSSIIDDMKKFLSTYKPCGPITVQLIRQKGTNKNYYIEINPRFGGGAPLSMKSGADSAGALLRLMQGEKPCYEQNAGVESVFSRFDQSVCTEHEQGRIKAVVFDLDDTLYFEKDYVKSGFKAVSDYLGDQKYFELLWQAFLNGEQAIDYVLKKQNVYTDDLKAKCLDVYRNHIPDIELSEEVKNLLSTLKEKKIKIGIITDGRVEGQRNKIKSLGIEQYVDEIIITDELGGVKFRKPNDISFRIMQLRLNVPFAQIVYVGDNVIKDFIAPRQLGMQTVLFDCEDGLYSKEAKATFIGDRIVSSLKELENIVK